ncbi:sugar transporter, partial [Nannochloropsis oceanica]
AMSVSCQVNWGCNFIIGIGFPFINAWLGKASFVPFGVVLTLTLAFTYIYLPETLGRTVQEIQQLAAVSASSSKATSMSDKFPVAMSKGSYGTNGGKKVGKEKGRGGGQKQQVVLSVDARDLAMQV